LAEWRHYGALCRDTDTRKLHTRQQCFVVILSPQILHLLVWYLNYALSLDYSVIPYCVEAEDFILNSLQKKTFSRNFNSDTQYQIWIPVSCFEYHAVSEFIESSDACDCTTLDRRKWYFYLLCIKHTSHIEILRIRVLDYIWRTDPIYLLQKCISINFTQSNQPYDLPITCNNQHSISIFLSKLISSCDSKMWTNCGPKNTKKTAGVKKCKGWFGYIGSAKKNVYTL